MEPCPKKIILAVDDEPGIRDLFREIGNDLGHIVLTASTGDEAIRRASSVKPHLLILDINMPGIDGWSALEEIRNRAGDPSMPAIICSAFLQGTQPSCDPERRNCTHIPKPFDIGNIEHHIERLLKGKPCHACGNIAGASA